MKNIVIALIATAALAAPTAALAHDGRGHHRGHGLYAKLSGTGTSFAGGSATASGTIASGTLLASGTFSATLTTTWASATTRTTDRGTVACAPATATLSVAGTTGTTLGNTLGGSLTGKTCSFTKTDGTVVRAFFGKGSATGAGTLAGVDGGRTKLWLLQRADGSVQGAVVAGAARTNVLYVKGERAAKRQSGDCNR